MPLAADPEPGFLRDPEDELVQRLSLPARTPRPESRGCRPSRSLSTSRSKRVWRFSQKRSLVPKKRERRSAVFAVTVRLPWTISLMRRGETLMPLARRYWLRPRGFRNSFNRISPGCIGSQDPFGHQELLVIVDDLHFVGAALTPREADTVSVVDADAVSAPSGHPSASPVDSLAARVSLLDLPLRPPATACEAPPAQTAWNHAASLPKKELRAFLVAEAPNHGRIVTRCGINVKRYQEARGGP